MAVEPCEHRQETWDAGEGSAWGQGLRESAMTHAGAYPSFQQHCR